MNKHDTLCPEAYAYSVPSDPEQRHWSCHCDLIARVRYDVLQFKHYDDQIQWEQAYKAGYEDAMKDFNMTFEDFKKRNEEWNEIMKAMNIKDSR